MTIFEPSADGLTFIGDFQALYEQEPDPWHQSAADHGAMADYYTFSRATLIEALWRNRAGPNGLEVGCGHGHLTARLRRAVCPNMTGLDISSVAIEQARKLHPECRFVAGDIGAPALWLGAEFDCIIWAQVWWYVLDRLDDAVANTIASLKPGGLFIISQAFLRTEQKYRPDVPGINGALRIMLARYAGRLQLVEARYDASDTYVHHDAIMVFRKVPHANRGDRAEP